MASQSGHQTLSTNWIRHRTPHLSSLRTTTNAPHRSGPRSRASECARHIHERRVPQVHIDQVVRRSASLPSLPIRTRPVRCAEAIVANPSLPHTSTAEPRVGSEDPKKNLDVFWTVYKTLVAKTQVQFNEKSGPDLGNLRNYHYARRRAHTHANTRVSFVVGKRLVQLVNRNPSGPESALQPRWVFVSGVQPGFSMSRGALHTYFKAAAPKKPKYEASLEKSCHFSYPFAIPHLPVSFVDALGFAPEQEGRNINDQSDLDLVYYQPYIPASIASGVFEFLRDQLPFYRVQYNVNRGGHQIQIDTPRYTTVFGIDETSRFTPEGDLVDAKTGKQVEAYRYRYKPRPIPQCLDLLRTITEGTTGETFNFCLVNYYADGQDSISYHSDDERFLGMEPAIASFSLGAKRDFFMKHKPISAIAGEHVAQPKAIKLLLGPGDMILMRGRTQANWLHSIPKRAGTDANKGRINITFRKAMVKAGTDNYYNYNVGSGKVYKWNVVEQKMAQWEQPVEGSDSGTGQAVASGSGQANGQ
ncbi:hypothetical protein IAQ61_004607 [Plenodomus lingam]|uniref:uncharacterized protein n=1 Tax=Leptosphaeria maculans TaxID=5022 RepID=UPI003316947F|nr:hypothetical protein IAQ61_004607 [Plenodomus lingam]